MSNPYYQDDYCTIYHGDCRDILPGLEPVDLVLTDPPYGMNLGHHKGINDKRSRELRKKGYLSYNDTPQNYKSIIVPAIKCALQISKRGAIFACAPSAWMLPPPSAIGGIYIAAANGRSPWGFQNLSSVLFYGVAPNLHKGSKHTIFKNNDRSDRGCGHPCPKPLAWLLWLVGLASVEKETILDPFMGSGTTLRAAKDLNRKATGIEIEEKYCEIAAKMLSQEVFNFESINNNP